MFDTMLDRRVDLRGEKQYNAVYNRIPYAMNLRNQVVVASFMVASSSSVLADMGTPLMWATMLHLVFGNALIGLLEGLVLALIFHLRKRKTIGLLVLANYFSAWVGYHLLRGSFVKALPLDLYNAWFYVWLMVGLSYIMTLILEFPFVGVAFWRDPNWLRKSVVGSLIIQTVSYALLFGWYWLASGTSLYTSTKVVQPSEIVLPKGLLIYFISAEDGHVYSQNLATRDRHKVSNIGLTNHDDRLLVRLNDDAWDLVARMATSARYDPTLVTIGKIHASTAAPTVDNEPYDEHMAAYHVQQLGNPNDRQWDDSKWEFQSGYWPIEGLQGTTDKWATAVGFAFETPFGAWRVRNATQMPCDIVLFQLGDDQICLFDPTSNRVALVAKGRGPVVVMNECVTNQMSGNTAGTFGNH